jgi:hypothetical protein
VNALRSATEPNVYGLFRRLRVISVRLVVKVNL